MLFKMASNIAILYIQPHLHLPLGPLFCEFVHFYKWTSPFQNTGMSTEDF